MEDLSPELLDKLADHLVEKALARSPHAALRLRTAGKPPAMIEEAKRRIAAGEEVTIEELERHQPERTNPQEPKA